MSVKQYIYFLIVTIIFGGKSILKFMLIGFTSLILRFFMYGIYFVLTTFIF